MRPDAVTMPPSARCRPPTTRSAIRSVDGATMRSAPSRSDRPPLEPLPARRTAGQPRLVGRAGWPTVSPISSILPRASLALRLSSTSRFRRLRRHEGLPSRSPSTYSTPPASPSHLAFMTGRYFDHVCAPGSSSARSLSTSAWRRGAPTLPPLVDICPRMLFLSYQRLTDPAIPQEPTLVPFARCPTSPAIHQV